MKALLKANQNEESAIRIRENEKIVNMANKRFDALEKLLEGRLGEEANKIIMQMETNRTEFIACRDSHENKLKTLEEKMDTNSTKLNDIDKTLKEKLDKFSDD